MQERSRYYTVGTDGKINGGGTDNRERAMEWLENNDNVTDLIAAPDREAAREKYIA